MQLRYVFTELGQGLRRNTSMHVAVVLTLFVSLTLVGMGVLLQRQTHKAEDVYGSQLQVTAYLCTKNDPNAACLGEVTTAERDAITTVISANPEVAGYTLVSQQQAYDNAKELIGADKFAGPHPAVTVGDFPQSIRITLKDPRQYQGIESAVQTLDGVARLSDDRVILKPIYNSVTAMKYAAVGTAAFLVLAALLLVANTIRLAAFARRKEIGIMRLVGASTLYIALPFLLEALVTALIGIVLAGGALAAIMRFVVHDRARPSLQFVPWVGLSDYGVALVWVAVLGAVLTLLPTLVLTRRYINV